MRQARRRKWRADLTQGAITISAGPRLRTAMILAIVADVLQLVVFPLVVQGAMSPADDILDLSVAGVLAYLLDWHWEFLPSFLAKLVPGVDLVPCCGRGCVGVCAPPSCPRKRFSPGSTWFPAGRSRLRMFIGNRSGSRSQWNRIESESQQRGTRGDTSPEDARNPRRVVGFCA